MNLLLLQQSLAASSLRTRLAGLIAPDKSGLSGTKHEAEVMRCTYKRLLQ